MTKKIRENFYILNQTRPRLLYRSMERKTRKRLWPGRVVSAALGRRGQAEKIGRLIDP